MNEIVYRGSGEEQGTGENRWNINLVVKQRLIKCNQKCKGLESITLDQILLKDHSYPLDLTKVATSELV